MNDIVDSQIDSALSQLISGLISFVLANLFIVLLIIAVIAGLIAMKTMNSKRKYATQSLKRANELQMDTASRLSTVLVTDTFKELELGLVQGETGRGLQRMEKAAYGLHQQSNELGVKLKGYRSNYFSPMESLHQAEELELEVSDLHERVERYLNDLSGIEQSVRNTGQQVRQLKDRLIVVVEQIDKLGEESGYSLDELRQKQIQVEEAFDSIDQLAAFDAIQAKPESVRFGRLIDALNQRTQELKKNITIMDQIRTRLLKQEEQLLQRIEQDQLEFMGQTPIQIFHTTDAIMEQLEIALRAGQEVDLRTVASEIEQILQRALELADGHS